MSIYTYPKRKKTQKGNKLFLKKEGKSTYRFLHLYFSSYYFFNEHFNYFSSYYYCFNEHFKY